MLTVAERLHAWSLSDKGQGCRQIARVLNNTRRESKLLPKFSVSPELVKRELNFLRQGK